MSFLTYFMPLVSFCIPCRHLFAYVLGIGRGQRHGILHGLKISLNSVTTEAPENSMDWFLYDSDLCHERV